MTAHRLGLTAALVLAAFIGGAAASRSSYATGEKTSPYAPLAQLAQVLVFMENHYVDPVERQEILDGAIKGMVAELDPHSAYMSPKEFTLFNEDTEGRFGGIGVEVDFKEDAVTVIAPIEGSPAFRAGIRPGDRLVAVDGKPLRGLPIDKIIELMRGPPESPIRLTVKREGEAKLLELSMVREHIRVKSVEGKRLVQGVGYLRLKQFQSGTHTELLRSIGELRRGSEPLVGVILDLRNNPGGLIDEAEAVANELLAGGLIYSTRHRGRVVEAVQAHERGALTKLPLITLVNEYSASSAELVAGALQDNGRSRIVGARTFGKGSVQTIFELPGGAGLRLTTMRYYTPKGRAIQVAGIRPDIVIRYATEGEPPAIREDTLEGHLNPESGKAGQGAAPIFDGGQRPEYVSVAELPADPAQGQDFALRLAHKLLLEAIAQPPAP